MKDDVRMFAASQIRKNLSQFSESSFVKLWENLTDATKSAVKTDLFSSIPLEKNKKIRHLICDAIGEIGGGVLDEDETAWPELIPIVWQMFQADNVAIIDGAFIILGNLIVFALE
jgi:hypothetical protein